MHELSIADALLNLAAEHVPAGAALRAVAVRAGPLRGIDPEAMEWAWQSVLADHPWAGAKLNLELLPMETLSNELTLQSIEVDDPVPQEAVP